MRSRAWMCDFSSTERTTAGPAGRRTDRPARICWRTAARGWARSSWTVRRQAVGAPDPLHRADCRAGDLGHGPAGPGRRLARRLAKRPFDQPRRNRDRRPAGLSRLVAQQAVDARLDEAPAPDAGFGHAGPAHDLHRAAAFGRGEDDPCPPDMLVGTVAIAQNRFQPLPITRAKPDLDVAAHARVVQQDLSLGTVLFRSDH